jgi:hypothetical protein
MKKEEAPQFPWALMFLVTAVSFFMFTGATKLINGSPRHSAFFLKVAIISSVASVLALIVEVSIKVALKEDN